MAVLSTLGLTEDRARWSADHGSSCKWQTPREEEGGLPDSHTPGVDMRHPPTGSHRIPKGARQITAPVVLA